MTGISLGLAAMLLVLGATSVWSYRAFKLKLPKNLGMFSALWGGGVLLGVLALVQGTADRGYAITAVALGGTLVFLLAAGKQKADGNPIAVGDTVPAFSAPDENDEIFDSSSFAGSAVVLKVFRGHW